MEPSHFEPFGWEIRLSGHKSENLGKDSLTRAAFIHEYIHYVQFLIGSLGRIQFMEFIRNIILAGIIKHYNNNVPDYCEQIDLRVELSKASPNDLMDTEAQINFQKNYHDLNAALDTALRQISPIADDFVFEPLRIHGPHGFEIPDFPHIVIHHKQQAYILPISDRVFFENMARQIQRNYLQSTLKDASSVDMLEGSLDEEIYICLWKKIKEKIQDTKESRIWTIVLCQISLICERPAHAFVEMYNNLIQQNVVNLNEFLRFLDYSKEIKNRYDKPSMQEIVNDLVQGIGRSIRMTETYELREIAKHMVNAHNDICTNPRYFANSLINWDHVLTWLDRFGCPPIIFDDKTLTKIDTIDLKKPWHDYLNLGRNLLLPLI